MKIKRRLFVISLPANIDLWANVALRKSTIVDAYTVAGEVEEVCQSLTRSIKKIYKVDGKLFCTRLPKR